MLFTHSGGAGGAVIRLLDGRTMSRAGISCGSAHFATMFVPLVGGVECNCGSSSNVLSREFRLVDATGVNDTSGVFSLANDRSYRSSSGAASVTSLSFFDLKSFENMSVALLGILSVH